MEQHNGKVAARHRQNATGVSFLLEKPGHGLTVPSFSSFVDFHLPPAVVETSGNRMSKLARGQDRVCPSPCLHLQSLEAPRSAGELQWPLAKRWILRRLINPRAA